MNTPADDRSRLAQAMVLASMVTAIVAEMAIPGLVGYWLDQWLGTKVVLTLLGIGVGLVIGIRGLLGWQRISGGEATRATGKIVEKTTAPPAEQLGSADSMRHGLDWQNRGLAFRLSVLTAAMVLACAIAAPVAYAHDGLAGGGQAALAAGVCLLCFSGALAVTRRLDPAHALHGLLLSILLRTGVPLVLLLGVGLYGGIGENRPLVFSFLFFYLVAMAVETPLALPVKAAREKSVTGVSTRG